MLPKKSGGSINKRIKVALLKAFLPETFDVTVLNDDQLVALNKAVDAIQSLNANYHNTLQAQERLSETQLDTLTQCAIETKSPYEYITTVVYDPMSVAYYAVKDYLEPVTQVAGKVVYAVQGIKENIGMLIKRINQAGRNLGMLDGYEQNFVESSYGKPLTTTEWVVLYSFHLFVCSVASRPSREMQKKLFDYYFSHQPNVFGIQFDAYDYEKMLSFDNSNPLMSDYLDCYQKYGGGYSIQDWMT